MIEFAYSRGGIAIVPEVLRQRDHVWHIDPEMGVEIIDPRAVRPKPGEQGSARRIAHRVLGKGPLESIAVRVDEARREVAAGP